MNTKEYLGQAYKIDQRIKSKMAQVRSLREMATKATNTLSDTPRSASPNIQPMESAIAKIVDLENEITAEIDSLVDKKRELVHAINAVPDIKQRTLLELRYLCFMTWEGIARELSISRTEVYRLRDVSEKNFQIPKNGIVWDGQSDIYLECDD